MVQAFVKTVVGEVMLVAHTAKAPSDEEWKVYVEGVVTHDPARLRSLVFTDGGAPNSTQRRVLNEALGGKTSLGAVVSPSTMVRGVVTALSWFNPMIKAFAPGETDEAFRYLGVTDSSDIANLWREARKLRVQLGDDTLRSIAKPR